MLDWKCTPSVYKHETASDLHQSIYPEGFYDVSPFTSGSTLHTL